MPPLLNPRNIGISVLLLVACAHGSGNDQSISPSEGDDAGAPPLDGGHQEPVPDAAQPEQDAGRDAAVVMPEPDASMPVVDAAVDAAVEEVDASLPVDPSLPFLHDFSGAPRAHVIELVHRALDGLGFPASEGPSPDDRVFIGRRYLAWIDQTGFYGKMNALFTLNGAAGEALDFVLTDPDGRPINLFVPGEDGDGAWPASYKGAEHVEFPSRTPEVNDNPSCASGDWCNQYGLNEALTYKNPSIRHWESCNVGAESFATRFEPIVVEESAGKLKLVYEGPLVKEADGDGNFDGDACHADYLFPDGVRRRVYLRVGYELFADAQYFDRTMQLRNPEGNPQLKGDMSLIGGYVMTRWPGPHYLKRLNRFWRPETRDATLNWDGTNVALHAATWNDLSTRTPSARDVLIGWADQPITLSAGARSLAGATVTLSHIGPSDNADVGVCLCAVHGGLEMGGGLIHAGVSLPIDAGQQTIEAKRRLTIPSSGPEFETRLRVYEAETGLAHGSIGRVDADGWAANTAADASGHMAYGPYATDWLGGSGQATVVLLVDDNNYDNEPVVTFEIYDSESGQTLVSRPIRRREFKAAHQYQRFTVNFELAGHIGHKMETRFWWHDVSYVRVDKVIVKLASEP